MSQLRKYTFNQNFINSQGNIIHPETEAARVEGYSAGYQDGLFKAKQDIEADIAAVLENTAEQLKQLANAQQEAHRFVTSSTISLVKEIAGKFLPHLIAISAEQEVISFTEQVLQKLRSQGHIKVTVHPDIQTNVTAYFETLQDIPCQISIDGDATLEKRDCKISWDDGGVEFIQSTTQAEIDRLLQNIIDNVPNHTEEQGEHND